MMDAEKTAQFEKTVWPHLRTAYNLARWLTRRDADAQDVVQEALLRAFKSFAGYRGGDARAWLLAIVRNTCYNWLRKNRSHEALEQEPDLALLKDTAPGPEMQAQAGARQALVRHALGQLPLEFREVLVLRELEGLSYKEIGEVAGLPIGTVMSRLARARDRMQAILKGQIGKLSHDL